MMRLSQAAQAIGARVIGQDVEIAGVSTDSRRIEPGDLFIALHGERFDGHAFVAQALAQGAVAVMVSRDLPAGVSGPAMLVEDTRLALRRLAAWWRKRFAIPVAGITGSNGKTTVKEMVAGILRAATAKAAVLATEGNLNNDIGLPLTLLRLRPTHHYAVIEMGMNHPGEIALLTQLALPTVALVNNAGAAHLAGLGSVEAVARAKGEIFEGLSADGVAVINADDAYAGLWRDLAAPHRVLTFGLVQPADVTAAYVLDELGSDLTITTPAGQTQLRLPVAGLHNVRNALAATAVALSMGADLGAVVKGLQGFSGAKGRLQRKTGIAGCTVIDDTYNANPASMRAAVDVLTACPGRRFLVLGDMGELGPDARRLHAEIGEYARAAGVDGLYTLGELARAYGGTPFDTPEALVEALRPQLGPDSTVLVKGSRFMRMERVVALLEASAEHDEGKRHAA